MNCKGTFIGYTLQKNLTFLVKIVIIYMCTIFIVYETS